MDYEAVVGDNFTMSAKKPMPTPQPTLRAWRKFKKLTLEQTANTIGIGPQAVHKWETGKVPVTLDNLRLLAEAYGTTPDALLQFPHEGELVERLRRAQAVMSAMPADRAERWLGMGEDIAGIEPTKKKIAQQAQRRLTAI